MSRTIIAQGAHGELARTVQRVLASLGFLVHSEVDGWYGSATAAAVSSFQRRERLAQSGRVDKETWAALLPHTPAPSLYERCLGLTSAFEGHDYTLAVGDFDGAWLTWGIVGFTMKYGMVQRILLEAERGLPGTLRQAFGETASMLNAVLHSSGEKQKAWAQSITLQNGMLSQPWRTGFKLLGRMEHVQRLQQQLADAEYFQPALKTAERWKLTSELGVALSFDAHVQNGGISARAARLIASQRLADEHERRIAIANAIADCARAAYREDVRARKLTIAEGRGTVHGSSYLLSNWGLEDLPAELALRAAAASGK